VALGYQVSRADGSYSRLETEGYSAMLEEVATDFPNLKVVATSLRSVRTATVNDWSGVCFAGGRFIEAEPREGLEILDRVGGGDSFASDLVFGLLDGRELEEALALAVAHGALAMTTPGDTSMATRPEVERLAAGGAARIRR
jgi:2-dehydro-3-deoxygluconokinase